MMKKTRTVLFCLALLPLAAVAQSNNGQSLDQIFDQMNRQMQKGIPGGDTIRLSPGKKEFYQISPDSSSYFYFKVDTSFSGGAMPDFFHFDPFGGSGQDSMGGFGGFDRMFKQMEELQRQMWGIPPSGITQEPEPDDGLLPEERIRLREEQEKTGVAPAAPKQPAKPKIKTTRI